MTWRLQLRRLYAGVSFAVAMTVASSMLATPSQAAGDPRFGVNRVNLAWLSAPEREKVLDLMVKSGVVAVRLSLTRPIDQSIDAIRVAHQKGLAILLEISLNNADFYPKGTKPRPGLGRIWDMYRLSDISPDQFRSVVGDALHKIDALQIPLVAVEAGNEINWGAYNGDLEVKAKAKSKTARSLTDLDNLAAVEQGAAKYVQLAAVVRKELQSTKFSANAKVISAGLSDIPVADADRRGIDSIDPASFTNLMRKHGLDKVVDGYGIHIYPGSNGTATARATHVSQALSICRSEPDGKPCWITEWGFSNTSTTCPANDNSRERLVEAARSRFEELMGTGRVAAAYYFDWDAKGYGVWRCGGLSPAGRAAVVTP
ncbi:glycoside hydrolase [Phyllobacterium myrsinacearum]|uniref:Glycoside hydrolase n=1 Tax=Phyllobacterium myrsinacearum TaxID=28101 RepID=A0A839EV20_9HYPH|nr:glycoside hydrolase [Phyllobacterium myrsinacearum]MBA8881955.1 hypothetical protein [Phyllobacterium myrsinacearum]